MLELLGFTGNYHSLHNCIVQYKFKLGTGLVRRGPSRIKFETDLVNKRQLEVLNVFFDSVFGATATPHSGINQLDRILLGIEADSSYIGNIYKIKVKGRFHVKVLPERFVHLEWQTSLKFSYAPALFQCAKRV